MNQLTDFEKAMLEHLAAECHEELKKGIPPAVISPVCNQCVKRLPGAICSRYPRGIPHAILLAKQECAAFVE